MAALDDFFSSLYEFGGLITIGQNGQFSYDLYFNGLYPFLGIVCWILNIIGLLVFYFVINHPRFNRWFHLLMVGGGIALLNGIIGYAVSYNTFASIGISYGFEYLLFAMVNTIFSICCFAFFTLLFRITRLADLSSNCSTCPFPN